VSYNLQRNVARARKRAVFRGNVLRESFGVLFSVETLKWASEGTEPIRIAAYERPRPVRATCRSTTPFCSSHIRASGDSCLAPDTGRLLETITHASCVMYMHYVCTRSLKSRAIIKTLDRSAERRVA